MNKTSISFLAVAFSVVGCAGGDQAPSETDENVLSSTQELTLQECETQRDTCLRKNPLFGLFTCPAQYTQCVATAENGLPAQVASAVAAAADCNATLVNCNADADTPAKLAICAEKNAQCVAAIVGVKLPSVVEGTATCINDTTECLGDARSVRDLTSCGTALQSCAVDQVVSLIPPEVAEVVTDANECRLELNECIGAATSASEVATCTEANAQCVAAILDVQLPDVPVAEAIKCTEDAADCALDAEKLSDVVECQEGLQACTAAIIGSVEVPEELTCEQKWTACVTANPFGFLACGRDLARCQD